MKDRNDVFFKRAHQLLRQGKYDELLKKILTAKQTLRAEAKSDENHAWYLLGDAFYKKNNYVKAVEAFTRAFNFDPGDDEAAFALGNAYFELGDLPAAEKWTRCAYEMSGNPEAGYNLANIFYDQGDYRLAVAVYKDIKGAHSALAKMAKANLTLAKKKLAPRPAK